MDNRDNISPNTHIEQPHETGKTSSGPQQGVSQPENKNVHPISPAEPSQPALKPETQSALKPETQSAPEPEAQSAPKPEAQSAPKPEAQSAPEPETQPKTQNVKKIHTPHTTQKTTQKLEPRPSGTRKKLAGVIIVAVVAVGSWLGYEVYIRPAQKGNIASRPVTVSPEVTKPSYQKLSEEIFASLERSFGEFVNAGAVEDYVFCETEDDLLQKWRGRNIFMFTGSRAGFIDTDKFSWSVSDSLQPSTLEINDAGTVFQADMSNAQSFSANSLIESAVTPANSLKPERFTDTQSMKRNITAYITRRLEANGTNGYIRFVLRTNIEGAKLMTAYSLNPSDASEKTYLVLSDNFMGFDGRTLRDIEDSINVMSDINAVSFTLRKGRVESYDSLTECLRKFVKSFAK